jgi:hypothetical protein
MWAEQVNLVSPPGYLLVKLEIAEEPYERPIEQHFHGSQPTQATQTPPHGEIRRVPHGVAIEFCS